MMRPMNSRASVPTPVNEPVLSYAPGSPERAKFFKRLEELKARKTEVPLFIGGEEVRTKTKREIRSPYDHGQVIGKVNEGGVPEIKKAIAASMKARKEWSRMPFEARAAIFLKAADLLAGDYRWTSTPHHARAVEESSSGRDRLAANIDLSLQPLSRRRHEQPQLRGC